ncbi:hypothetical protein, partial [Rhizobium johnstonii]|uniref:hypothetical protein n=1 Tax=Rhizobium johnstonii TaxID=3019933 RepID=UPI003F9C6714
MSPSPMSVRPIAPPKSSERFTAAGSALSAWMAIALRPYHSHVVGNEQESEVEALLKVHQQI